MVNGKISLSKVFGGLMIWGLVNLNTICVDYYYYFSVALLCF